MRSFCAATVAMAGVMACPAIASAQCEAVSIVTDGRIRVIDPTHYAWFYTAPGRSYSVEVTTPDGMTGVTPFGPVLSTVANCPTSTDAAGAVNISHIEPRVLQGARWSYTNTGTSSVGLRIRVGGLGFRVSASETTLFNPTWSTGAGLGTQWGFQNTTDHTLTGTLTVQESIGGTSSYTKTVSLPPDLTTFVTTYDQFGGSTIPSGRGGSATFTHNGPPGAVQGDVYLVGATQILPGQFKAMRESAH